MAITVRIFAALREARGQDAVQVTLQPGDTPRAIFERLFPDRPHPDWPGALFFAVDGGWVDGDATLQDGVELALIPPLGGGGHGPRVALVHGPIDAEPLRQLVAGPERGGVVTFSGTARDSFEGRRVVKLVYEAYEPMALQQMARLCDAIEAEFPGVRLAMVHRLGEVPVGEAAVHVVAAGGHRDESFAACRAGIDRLKAGVPIFKQEVYEGGAAWKDDGGRP